MPEVTDREMARKEFTGDVSTKVERLVYYSVNHHESIKSLKSTTAGLGERILDLEKSERERKLAEVRREERDIRLEDRLNSMMKATEALSEEIKSLKATGSKALWVFVGALILAATRFILEGGLSNV